MSTAFVVAIAGMGGYQIADTWVAGSIFKRPQEWLRKRRAKSKVAELLTCSFCLAHWTVLICLLLLLLTSWDSPCRWPVYWFAAVKVALLVQRDEEIVLDQTAEVAGIEVMDESPDQAVEGADDDSPSGEPPS